MPETTRIVVSEERDDCTARLADNSAVYESGRTKLEALGRLFLTISQSYNFQIVSEKEENRFLLDKLQRDFGKIDYLVRGTQILQTDVGKIFVMNKEETGGVLMTSEDLLNYPLAEIGGWRRIGEFDVNA